MAPAAAAPACGGYGWDGGSKLGRVNLQSFESTAVEGAVQSKTHRNINSCMGKIRQDSQDGIARRQGVFR